MMLVVVQVVDIQLEDGRVRVNLEDDHKIIVQDILSETLDELEFRDKVVKISLGEGRWPGGQGVHTLHRAASHCIASCCVKSALQMVFWHVA